MTLVRNAAECGLGSAAVWWCEFRSACVVVSVLQPVLKHGPSMGKGHE